MRAPVVVVDVVVDEVDRVVVVVGTRKTQSDGSGPRQPAEARQRLLQLLQRKLLSEYWFGVHCETHAVCPLLLTTAKFLQPPRHSLGAGPVHCRLHWASQGRQKPFGERK